MAYGFIVGSVLWFLYHGLFLLLAASRREYNKNCSRTMRVLASFVIKGVIIGGVIQYLLTGQAI